MAFVVAPVKVPVGNFCPTGSDVKLQIASRVSLICQQRNKIFSQLMPNNKIYIYLPLQVCLHSPLVLKRFSLPPQPVNINSRHWPVRGSKYQALCALKQFPAFIGSKHLCGRVLVPEKTSQLCTACRHFKEVEISLVVVAVAEAKSTIVSLLNARLTVIFSHLPYFYLLYIMTAYISFFKLLILLELEIVLCFFFSIVEITKWLFIFCRVLSTLNKLCLNLNSLRLFPIARNFTVLVPEKH